MTTQGVEASAQPSQSHLRLVSGYATSTALSIVVPVRDEAGNIGMLVQEIHAALAGTVSFEVIFVDDGSTDATAAAVIDAMSDYPDVRCLQHPRSLGQSAALRSGILAARNDLVVTMDGDGQNDPADIVRLLGVYRDAASDPALALVAGQRAVRRDDLVRRISSAVANGIRRWLLHDQSRDTGCGLKLLRRDAFRELPYFDHMHRFLPALMQRAGYDCRFVDVHHRPRAFGRSKYTVWNRLWVGIVDLLGVMWLRRRRVGAGRDFEELGPEEHS